MIAEHKNVHGGSESGPVPERSRPGRSPTRARARTRACPPTLVGEVLVAPCRSSRRQTEQHPGRCCGRSATRLAGEHFGRADDLWLGGTDVAAVLDDDGNVDSAKVAAVAASVLDGRPQIGESYRPRLKPDDAR